MIRALSASDHRVQTDVEKQRSNFKIYFLAILVRVTLTIGSLKSTVKPLNPQGAHNVHTLLCQHNISRTTRTTNI